MFRGSLQLSGSVFTCSLIIAGLCLGQTTERVSVDSLGAQGNDRSHDPSISADGRYSAFLSYSTNLVPGDTNGVEDIFVHDRQTGVTELVSVNPLGGQGNERSFNPFISADGRYVAFSSRASNLVPGDTNGDFDIFVHDRRTGMTKRVSVDSLGVQGNSYCDSSSISADGRYVVFHSNATNLVPGDTNGRRDIFVHDRQTGMTERVSVDSFGGQGNNLCDKSSISADGRYVAFDSLSSNLVLADTNGEYDIFVHDRQTGVTERVSVDSLGVQGNDLSLDPSLSADGRYVSFDSFSSNLVPGDTNGDRDIFVHDRQTGVTGLVSVDSLGVQGNSYSDSSSISADGRYVTFASEANDLWPEDTNAHYDIFVHDRQTGVTERVSVDSLGVQGNSYSDSSSISADGRYVVFRSRATRLVPEDTNWTYDIFIHDRWDGLGANSIYLTGPSTSPVSAPVDLSWQTTRGNSQFWLLFSQNKLGSVIHGHAFDIGALNHGGILATGTHTANGLGSFTTQPRLAYAGHTIYLEVAAQDADGILYDSNLLPIAFY